MRPQAWVYLFGRGMLWEEEVIPDQQPSDFGPSKHLNFCPSWKDLWHQHCSTGRILRPTQVIPPAQRLSLSVALLSTTTVLSVTPGVCPVDTLAEEPAKVHVGWQLELSGQHMGPGWGQGCKQSVRQGTSDAELSSDPQTGQAGHHPCPSAPPFSSVSGIDSCL